MMHNIACLYAQASVHAEADLTKDDRQARATDYRRRAVDAVAKTLEMLPAAERAAFWRDKIVPDAALVPLRNEPGFQEIAKSAGKL